MTELNDADLPPLPAHPEPHIMKWSKLEENAIRAYASEAVRNALATQAPTPDPVARVTSWASSSYGRKYQLEWLRDVPEGALLYTAAPATTPTESIAAVLDRAERNMKTLNAWDNSCASVSAGGVKTVIEDIRAILGATQAPALTDEQIDAIVEGAWHTAETETANGEAPETEWLRYGQHIARALLPAASSTGETP